MGPLDAADGSVPDRVVAHGLVGGGLPVEADGRARCRLVLLVRAWLAPLGILRGPRPAPDRVGPELAGRPRRARGGLIAPQARVGLRILWLLSHARLPARSRATLACDRQRASDVPRPDAL